MVVVVVGVETAGKDRKSTSRFRRTGPHFQPRLSKTAVGNNDYEGDDDDDDDDDGGNE